MTAPDPTAVRKQLCAQGYTPLPLYGKVPPIYGKNNARRGFTNWQTLHDVSTKMIEMHQKSWPDACNTGIVCGTSIVGLDLDVLHPDAADALERLAREMFEEHGEIAVRFGLPPKRLIPLRTDEPFAKLARQFIAPDGNKAKIEVLANGQQFVCDGIHPGTQKPYSWFGRRLEQIPRDELPYVREGDMQAFLDAATKLLLEDFNFTVEAGAREHEGDDRDDRDDRGEHASNEKLTAAPERIAAALAVIPNEDLDWDDWNVVGMAAWRATNGADVAFQAFDAWSRKSRKYDVKVTAQKWTAYAKSPPQRLGAGTIFYLANKADPSWEQREAKAKIEIHWHGETPLKARAWTIPKLLPETGAGLIAGQWGLYKTFCALDLAAALAANGGKFINFPITRRGGTLFIATEGAGEIALRFEAALREKYPTLTRAPFAWIEDCPPLTSRNAVDTIVAIAKEVEAHLQKDFELPLVLIVIDTMVTAAGYQKAGDENDAAVHAQLMQKLALISRRTGAFALAVDHFGKDVSTGTRGSSVKETNADVVLALIGERSITGAVTDTKLAVRKNRAGAGGTEFPFSVRLVEVPFANTAESTLVIHWGDSGETAAKPKKDDWGRSKAVKLLRRTIMNLLVDHGEVIRPWADGPQVRALKLALVEEEFRKSYPATGSEAEKREIRRKALRRALDKADDKIISREIEGTDYVWLREPGPGETQGVVP